MTRLNNGCSHNSSLLWKQHKTIQNDIVIKQVNFQHFYFPNHLKCTSLEYNKMFSRLQSLGDDKDKNAV